MNGGIRTIELEQGEPSDSGDAALGAERPSYLDAEERAPVGPRTLPAAVDELVSRGELVGEASMDDRNRATLREYLVGSLGTACPRPQAGTEVRVTLETDDVERARRALRTFARRPRVYDPLAVAATSLDVALQDLRQFVCDSAGSVTVSIDRWDCALVQFAVAETLGRDADDGDLSLDPSGGRGSDRSRLDLHCPQ